MSTNCYAMVRGSVIRVTSLDDKGRVGDPVRYATSKAVASVRINEVVETGRVEMETNTEDEQRLRFVRPATHIRSTVDIRFLRVDPGVYSLISNQVLTRGLPGVGGGFGEGAFGEMAFGDSESVEGSDTTNEGWAEGVEFDSRGRPVSFALEVWSKLSGQRCADGTRQWGYTVFQHLRGGRIAGFAFSGGLVSFDLVGAQSRRSDVWGVGPHDLEGDFERMTSAVSRNNVFRQMILSGAPPQPVDGSQVRYDVISNGDAANPMPDPTAPFVLSGGGAVTSPYIISGGRA